MKEIWFKYPKSKTSWIESALQKRTTDHMDSQYLSRVKNHFREMSIIKGWIAASHLHMWFQLQFHYSASLSNAQSTQNSDTKSSSRQFLDYLHQQQLTATHAWKCFEDTKKISLQWISKNPPKQPSKIKRRRENRCTLPKVIVRETCNHSKI